MIATITLNPKQQLHQLVDRLSDEKILSLYHFAAYLAQLDDRRIMEEEAAIVAAEDTAQVNERDDTAYLMASSVMRERLLTRAPKENLVPFEAVREQLGI